MGVEGYEEVKDVILSGDYTQALSKYADFINDTVNYVVNTDVLDEPSYMLDSIKNQKAILQKAETTFETLKKDSFEPEDTVKKLQELHEVLKTYEEFVKEMKEEWRSPSNQVS